MKACLKCKSLEYAPLTFCGTCGGQLSEIEKSDEFLKRFLGIDGATLDRFKAIREETIKEAERARVKSGPLAALGISGSARAVNDTAAEDSNSEFLLKAALAELGRSGVKTELLALRDYDIKPCKACYSTTNTQCHFYCSCYPKNTEAADDMTNILYDKILAADILMIATPVNNFKISSYLALFLDRCISLDGSLPPADPAAPKDRELNIKHTKYVQIMADGKIPGSGFLRRFFGKTAGIIVTGHEEGAAMVISQLFMTLNHFGMAFPPFNNMYAMSSILRGTYEDKPTVRSAEFVEEAEIVARNVKNMADLLRKSGGNWEYDYSSN